MRTILLEGSADHIGGVRQSLTDMDLTWPERFARDAQNADVEQFVDVQIINQTQPDRTLFEAADTLSSTLRDIRQQDANRPLSVVIAAGLGEAKLYQETGHTKYGPQEFGQQLIRLSELVKVSDARLLLIGPHHVDRLRMSESTTLSFALNNRLVSAYSAITRRAADYVQASYLDPRRVFRERKMLSRTLDDEGYRLNRVGHAALYIAVRDAVYADMLTGIDKDSAESER
ncbi:MAG: hypothetical protein JWL85_528 [Candidatus Saccharibacteria bacterium]|nr:hypothetical protein [Candidatus Saccharibacteria bacterium]